MVKKKNRMKLLGLYASIIIIVILLAYLFSSPGSDEDNNGDVEFPQALGGLEKEYDYGGERAMSEISNMHMGEFDFEEGYIGYYELDGVESAYIWVSVCSDEAAAVVLIEKMTVKISTVESPFSTPVLVSTEYSLVELIYYTSGTGQEHYYWQDGDTIVWVALENMNNTEVKSFMNSAIENF